MPRPIDLTTDSTDGWLFAEDVVFPVAGPAAGRPTSGDPAEAKTEAASRPAGERPSGRRRGGKKLKSSESGKRGQPAAAPDRRRAAPVPPAVEPEPVGQSPEPVSTATADTAPDAPPAVPEPASERREAPTVVPAPQKVETGRRPEPTVLKASTDKRAPTVAPSGPAGARRPPPIHIVDETPPLAPERVAMPAVQERGGSRVAGIAAMIFLILVALVGGAALFRDRLSLDVPGLNARSSSEMVLTAEPEIVPERSTAPDAVAAAPPDSGTVEPKPLPAETDAATEDSTPPDAVAALPPAGEAVDPDPLPAPPPAVEASRDVRVIDNPWPINEADPPATAGRSADTGDLDVAGDAAASADTGSIGSEDAAVVADTLGLSSPGREPTMPPPPPRPRPGDRTEEPATADFASARQFPEDETSDAALARTLPPDRGRTQGALIPPEVASRQVPPDEPSALAEPDFRAAPPQGDQWAGMRLGPDDGPRVVVHVPVSAQAAFTPRLSTALHSLTGNMEIREVTFEPSVNLVRYFYPDDREEAQAIRRAVAAAQNDWDVALSNFTHYRPRPRRGTIEVWLTPRG